MTPHPLTLRVDSDFRSALAVMQAHAIHHLPVVDAEERVLGIVAERDLLLAALQFPTTTADIGDVMHKQVVCVRDNAPITHAATLMAKNAIGGLPVIDARDRVVGIITETDLFRAFVGVLEAKTARPEAVIDDALLDDVAPRAITTAGRSKHAKPVPAAVRASATAPKAATRRAKVARRP